MGLPVWIRSWTNAHRSKTVEKVVGPVAGVAMFGSVWFGWAKPPTICQKFRLFCHIERFSPNRAEYLRMLTIKVMGEPLVITSNDSILATLDFKPYRSKVERRVILFAGSR